MPLVLPAATERTSRRLVKDWPSGEKAQNPAIPLPAARLSATVALIVADQRRKQFESGYRHGHPEAAPSRAQCQHFTASARHRA